MICKFETCTFEMKESCVILTEGVTDWKFYSDVTLELEDNAWTFRAKERESGWLSYDDDWEVEKWNKFSSRAIDFDHWLTKRELKIREKRTFFTKKLYYKAFGYYTRKKFKDVFYESNSLPLVIKHL